MLSSCIPVSDFGPGGIIRQCKCDETNVGIFYCCFFSHPFYEALLLMLWILGIQVEVANSVYSAAAILAPTIDAGPPGFHR